MEVRTEPMNVIDLAIMNTTLGRSQRVLRKAALFFFGTSAFILFVPMEYSKYLTRRGGRKTISGMLFNEIGLTNTTLFIVLPICIILFFLYNYGAKRVKADIDQKLKEIGRIKVVKIEELDERTKKDLMGTADHIIKFEKNPFKINENYFLKSAKPEMMTAKEYIVEVSKIAKVELRRELIK